MINVLTSILIDPPYNIGKRSNGMTLESPRKGINQNPILVILTTDWMEEVFVQLNRVMKDSGSFWFFHNDFMMMAELDRPHHHLH